MPSCRLVTVLFVLALITGSGCKSSHQSATLPTPAVNVTLAQTTIDTASLANDVHRLLDLVYIRMIGVADDVTSGSESAEAREAALRLKIRVAATTQVLAGQPDPRLALCNIWIIIVEGRIHFETQTQKEIFGDFQPRMVEVATDLEAEVVAIGRRHFGDALMDEAKPQIEALAEENVLSGRFLAGFAFAGASSSGDSQGMGKILGMPLAPIAGLQGIADTPQAITQATAIAANLIQNLPARARWEVEMLLPKVREQAEMMVSTVRQEVDSMVADVNAAQGPLQETLTKANETVAGLNEVMGKAGQLATTADEITKQLTEAGVAWDNTAKSATVLVASVQQLVESTAKKPPTGGAEPAESASIQDYLNAVSDVREAATQLNSAIGRLESNKLEQVVASVQGLSASTLNALTVRAIIVIAVLLVAMLIYRAAAVRMTSSER